MVKQFDKNPPRKKNIKENIKDINPQQALLQRMKKKKTVSAEERQTIIDEHTSLVQIIAANIMSTGKSPPNLHFNDLLSTGTEGLIKAWENFDAGRGIQFKAYASYRIRGEILDKIRKEWKYQNPGNYKSIYGRAERKVAQAVSDTKETSKGGNTEGEVKEVIANSAMAYLLSFEDVTEEATYKEDLDPGESVVDRLEFSRERNLLWEAVRGLSDDEKQIIKSFYIEDKTQNDIAKELGYSKSKVSRMHAAVLLKLRVRLQKNVSR